jgi:MOSC domain-containing protein YiiM
VGFRFEVGGAQFEGVQTCEPCDLMRSRTSPTAFKWFIGKGGLRAKVLRSGMLKVGDAFRFY